MTVPGRDVVYCSDCQEPIALPHESPLGVFQGIENSPTYEWPADFLCPLCGKEFSCSGATVDDLVPVRVADAFLPDLLRVEYVAVQGSLEIRKRTYTTCPKDSDPRNEVPRLQKHLSGVRQILHLHVSPHQL
jgi:hypothetical protein